MHAYEVRTGEDGMGGRFVGGPVTLSRHNSEGAAERACDRQRREGYRHAYAVRLADGRKYHGGGRVWVPGSAEIERDCRAELAAEGIIL